MSINVLLLLAIGLLIGVGLLAIIIGNDRITYSKCSPLPKRRSLHEDTK